MLTALLHTCFSLLTFFVTWLFSFKILRLSCLSDVWALDYQGSSSAGYEEDPKRVGRWMQAMYIFSFHLVSQ